MIDIRLLAAIFVVVSVVLVCLRFKWARRDLFFVWTCVSTFAVCAAVFAFAAHFVSQNVLKSFSAPRIVEEPGTSGERAPTESVVPALAKHTPVNLTPSQHDEMLDFLVELDRALQNIGRLVSMTEHRTRALLAHDQFMLEHAKSLPKSATGHRAALEDGKPPPVLAAGEVDYRGWRPLSDLLAAARSRVVSGRPTVSDIEALLQVQVWLEGASAFVLKQNGHIDALFAALKTDGLQLKKNQFGGWENNPGTNLQEFLAGGIAPDPWEKHGESFTYSLPPVVPTPASFSLQEILDQTVLPTLASASTRLVDLSGERGKGLADAILALERADRDVTWIASVVDGRRGALQKSMALLREPRDFQNLRYQRQGTPNNWVDVPDEEEFRKWKQVAAESHTPLLELDARVKEELADLRQKIDARTLSSDDLWMLELVQTRIVKRAEAVRDWSHAVTSSFVGLRKTNLFRSADTTTIEGTELVESPAAEATQLARAAHADWHDIQCPPAVAALPSITLVPWKVPTEKSIAPSEASNGEFVSTLVLDDSTHWVLAEGSLAYRDATGVLQPVAPGLPRSDLSRAAWDKEAATRLRTLAEPWEEVSSTGGGGHTLPLGHPSWSITASTAGVFVSSADGHRSQVFRLTTQPAPRGDAETRETAISVARRYAWLSSAMLRWKAVNATLLPPTLRNATVSAPPTEPAPEESELDRYMAKYPEAFRDALLDIERQHVLNMLKEREKEGQK